MKNPARFLFLMWCILHCTSYQMGNWKLLGWQVGISFGSRTVVLFKDFLRRKDLWKETIMPYHTLSLSLQYLFSPHAWDIGRDRNLSSTLFVSNGEKIFREWSTTQRSPPIRQNKDVAVSTSYCGSFLSSIYLRVRQLYLRKLHSLCDQFNLLPSIPNVTNLCSWGET